MRAAAARELLERVSTDPSVMKPIDPTRDRKVVDALLSVRDEMSASALRKAVGKIASSISWRLLFNAARKSPPEPAGAIVASAIGKHRELDAKFYKHAHGANAGAEAAQWVVDTDKSPHLPSLIKRLAKMPPPSTKMVAAAKAVLSAKPKKGWFEFEFLACCGLLGLLIKSGSPSALKIVNGVTAEFERMLGSHESHDPEATVARIRKGLGAAPTKKTASKKKASKKKASKKKAAAKKQASKKASKKAGAANPTRALAAARGFSVAGKREWHARVWMAKGEPNVWFGAMQEQTQLLLTLDAKSKPYWEVVVRPKHGHQQYRNIAGNIIQDDFDLPALRHLDDLPAWLGPAGKKMKTRFTPAKANISTGRQRKLIEELRGWLATGS